MPPPARSRRVAAGGLVLIGAALWAWSARVRVVESQLLARLLAVVLGRPTVPGAHRPQVFWTGAGGVRGIEISASCSSGRIASPALVAGALLVLTRRVAVARVVVAAVAAVGALTAINQARLLVIAVSIDRYGAAGSVALHHAIAGSIVTVFAVALCLAAGARVAFGGRRPAPGRGALGQEASASTAP